MLSKMVLGKRVWCKKTTSYFLRRQFSILIHVDIQRVRVRRHNRLLWRSITAFGPRAGRYEAHRCSSLAFQCGHRVCILRHPVVVVGITVDFLARFKFLLLSLLLLTSLQGLGCDEVDVGTITPLVLLRIEESGNEFKGVLVLCLHAPLDPQHLLESIFVAVLHLERFPFRPEGRCRPGITEL